MHRLSQRLRSAFAQLAERLRLGLDIPSRRELGVLSSRLEALGERIAALEELKRAESEARAPATSKKTAKRKTSAAKSSKAKATKASSAKPATKRSRATRASKTGGAAKGSPKAGES